MKKRFGFTLAEVLITLGIIGVVAAMTIPTLISNTNSAKFRSQFKKTISTLNQAGLMAQAQYDIDFGMVNAACSSGTGDKPDQVTTFCSILNGTLTGQTYLAKSPYSSAVGISSISGFSISNYHLYSLADGSLVAFPKAWTANNYCTLDVGTPMDATWISSHGNCVGFIDVNGKTLPNKEVTCSEAGSTGGSGVQNLKANLDPNNPCIVKNDALHMTDIYPVVFHDATVEPASNAAKYVLSTSK